MLALLPTNFRLLASRLGGRLIFGIGLVRRSLASLHEGFHTIVWIGRVDLELFRTVAGTAAEVTNDFSCRTRISSLGKLFDSTPILDETFRHGVPGNVTLSNCIDSRDDGPHFCNVNIGDENAYL